MNNIKNILIVDDDMQVRRLMEIILRRAGYDTVSTATGVEALELFSTGKFEIVITDLNMPVIDGRELLHCLKKINPDATVIIITGEKDEEQFLQLMKEGACKVINKFNFSHELLSTLSNIRGKNDLVKDTSLPYLIPLAGTE